MKRTCVQCGNEFELTNSEVDFYKKKNLSLPKRCQACREKNKQQNNKPQMRQPSPAAGSSPASASPSAGGGKGIMATVAGIMLLLVVCFFLRQTGILPDVKDNPSAATDLQTAGPTPEETTVYTFRSEKLLLDHYKKHGIDMGFDSAEAYEAAANEVIHNPDALHKLEAEDGDDIYYLEATNEFVVVSTDGYIRTYFNPDKGIDYYNRQ